MIDQLNDLYESASDEEKRRTSLEYDRLRSAFAAGILYGREFYDDDTTEEEMDDAFGSFLMSELIKRIAGLVG